MNQQFSGGSNSSMIREESELVLIDQQSGINSSTATSESALNAVPSESESFIEDGKESTRNSSEVAIKNSTELSRNLPDPQNRNMLSENNGNLEAEQNTFVLLGVRSFISPDLLHALASAGWKVHDYQFQ